MVDNSAKVSANRLDSTAAVQLRGETEIFQYYEHMKMY